MAGFRTIVIGKRCKLESQLGMMVIRGEGEDKVHIREIETLIVESTAVALTAALVADLTAAGVNVLFCDQRHMPCAAFVPMHANFGVSRNIKEQIGWSADVKGRCWSLVIKEKIRQQALHLQDLGKEQECQTLFLLHTKVQRGDIDNVEGRAAAWYFRHIFEEVGNLTDRQKDWEGGFTRDKPCIVNSALNYGYTLILSTFAKEIAACGYLTELGIWHKGGENAFNLASDLMEPYRIVVDRMVAKMSSEQAQNYKRYMLTVFENSIKINQEKQSLVASIRIYLHRIFRYLRGEIDSIFVIDIVKKDG
ncbi:MAG: type II CRISPR-associated endonuclease Cas1 [Firmicutes bacterium]|nr:type II CRISPR-associated endonuclease Cas1 [Bacillota bacterium]